MTARIYLDVDGVLNHAGTPSVQHTVAEAMVAGIDPACVDRLRRIVDATSAEIVLSSTWRTMPEAARAVGLAIAPLVVADVTPLDVWAAVEILDASHPRMSEYSTPERGLEIAAHLHLHPVERFVILDDWDLNLFAGRWRDLICHLAPHHVRTHARAGLTDRDTDRAIAILRGDL